MPQQLSVHLGLTEMASKFSTVSLIEDLISLPSWWDHSDNLVCPDMKEYTINHFNVRVRQYNLFASFASARRSPVSMQLLKNCKQLVASAPGRCPCPLPVAHTIAKQPTPPLGRMRLLRPRCTVKTIGYLNPIWAYELLLLYATQD